MSTLKVNNLQVGQDSTPTNNLTWFQPGTPDGTIRLGSGNSGSATTKFTFDKDGNLTCVGDITANSIIAPIEGTLDDWIVHAGDTNTKFGFSAADTFSIETAGSERLRITSVGTVNIGDADHVDDEYLGSTLKIQKDQNSVTRFTMRNEDSGSGSAAAVQIGATGNSWMLHVGSNANNSNAFTIRVDGTSNSNTGTERFHITTGGRVNIANSNQTGSHLDYTRLNVYGQTAHGGTNKNLNLLNVYNYGSGNVGDITGIGLGCGASPGGYTKASIGFIRTGTYGRGDLTFYINSQGNGNQVVEGDQKLRITSNGHIVTQGLSSYSFQNDSANCKILEVTGDGTVGEYGAINISGNQNANNSNIGNLRFINRENTNTSSGNSATSKQVAAIQAYIKSDGNSSNNSGGILTFHTKGQGDVNGERVRIDDAGRLLVGNFTDDIGDGTLQVYTADRKHPAIRTNSPNANGYTMFSDSYQSDESQVNFGVSYSSSSLVLSRCCKVSDAADNTYLSSQDTYNARPTALVLDNDGALRFHTTESNATTTTDSAVSLTEVFKVDKVGNIYQRISNRYMWFGASNQLQIGVNGSDPYINSASGDLQVRDAGNVCYVVRSDNLQMYMDIKMNQGKGISFINAADTATGETVSSSVLDEYEEGDWTPSNAHLSVNNVYSARYIKVGRIVHISFAISFAASPADTAQTAWVDGLPFQSHNKAQYVTLDWVGTSSSAGYRNSNTEHVIFANTSRITFYYPTGAHAQTRSHIAGKQVRGTFTYLASA